MPAKRKVTTRTPETTKAPREKRVTRGGRKIAKLFAAERMTITELSKRSGVDRILILRATNGERWEYISVDFAIAMRDATKGYTTIEDFASITALPVGQAGDEDEDEPPLRRKKTGTDG